MNQLIFGERIRQAREACGFTQTYLAKRVGIKQAAIAQFENEQTTPSAETLEAIAKETKFLPSFFEQPPIGDFPVGSLCFRARNSISKREEYQAYQYAKIMFELIIKSASVLRLPKPKLPILDEKPVTAARVSRAVLGLSPDDPIKNQTRTLEKNGVIVLSLPMLLPKLDAFSTWTESKFEYPVIAITPGHTTDRVRFSMAHELGHLVIHRTIRGQLKALEKEANIFAAEFLLPETAMRRELLPPITLSRLAKIKVRWGVSMQVLINRAWSLNVISDRQRSYLFEQMSVRGWRKREPSNLDLPPEIPIAYRKIIELAYENPEQYATDMHLTTERAQDIIMLS